jgi:hypothetical protein
MVDFRPVTRRSPETGSGATKGKTMKTNIQRNTIQTLLAAALLATGLLGRPASAQARFTLPHETRWGRAVLPPGDYQLTFDNNNVDPTVVVRDGMSLRVVAYELTDVRNDSTKGPSALLIGTGGKQWVVLSLRSAEFGEIFVYEHPPAQGGAVEARQTRAIPVVVAKK